MFVSKVFLIVSIAVSGSRAVPIDDNTRVKSLEAQNKKLEAKVKLLQAKLSKNYDVVPRASSFVKAERAGPEGLCGNNGLYEADEAYEEAKEKYEAAVEAATLPEKAAMDAAEKFLDEVVRDAGAALRGESPRALIARMVCAHMLMRLTNAWSSCLVWHALSCWRVDAVLDRSSTKTYVILLQYRWFARRIAACLDRAHCSSTYANASDECLIVSRLA